ncbi:MAG: hypothetical protein COA79_25415 [Planctomycetota bacterium]|nr:MAG: hypothetical protein COA79_25415 [Planctomycetota bacterium]
MNAASRFIVKKGLDLNLSGAPMPMLDSIQTSALIAVHGREFKNVKPRLLIEVGDKVKCGTALYENKVVEEFKVVSPVSGVIKEIVRGERRSIDKILIESSGDEAIEFPKFTLKSISNSKREDLIKHLFDTGFIAYIQERPFSKIPIPDSKPKSIFVNGMATGPFQPNLTVVIKENEEAFNLGLELLNQLTEGSVHLCLSDKENKSHELPEVLTNAKAKVHYFGGPHPSGNTSIHIDRIDPFKLGDTIWSIKGVDLIQIGKLFLNGKIPNEKIICVAGQGVKEDSRKYYNVKLGCSLKDFFESILESGEQRIISGDVLSGSQKKADMYMSFSDNGFTVIPEGRERHFLGWMSAGVNKLSNSRLFASSLLGGKENWRLNTNKNGSLRALVATGWYDRVMPMDIYVDVLVKAVLANDFDLAIQLGILEVAPEDFALCTFVCPSKVEIQSIIEDGLNYIEEEGI